MTLANELERLAKENDGDGLTADDVVLLADMVLDNAPEILSALRGEQWQGIKTASDADLVEGLTRVKDSFNSYPLGRPAQAGAIASIEDEAYFQASRARVIEGRERLNRGLVHLGFEVLPSAANFVFARHPAHDGAALATALRQRAVIVRHFSAPRISDYLRITVGTDGQIDRLLSALSDILGKALGRSSA